MKIGVVVQRYGAAINGGAELHARYIAEHLARHVTVEVLTTCATNYITWANELAPGTEQVTGVRVHRFPVAQPRDPAEFGRLSRHVFSHIHSLQQELAWLEAEGPESPQLIAHLRTHAHTFDFFVFFSFRYYHAYHGVRSVPGKAILVPTAERDGALGLGMFGPIFRGVRALMYNSPEERATIHAVADNAHVPGVVVGIGSEIPATSSAARFRQKFGIRDRFAIYVGRIDENKGCGELFGFFEHYSRLLAEGLHLVLIGTPVIAIPDHPHIHHLGFVSDEDKFDALAAAELLIMPSYFESLSMVALEAWALGKPVLANGRCEVLRGQCIRSNGGLYYDSRAEFVATMRAMHDAPLLAAALGANGRAYFAQHYAWPVIEQKYLDVFAQLQAGSATAALEPLPGWLTRRRKTLRPADEVVAALPAGPVLESRRRGRSHVTAPMTERHEPADPQRVAGSREPGTAGSDTALPARTKAADSERRQRHVRSPQRRGRMSSSRRSSPRGPRRPGPR